MKIEDFTDAAANVITAAVDLSKSLHHGVPDVDHLLFCILDQDDSTVVNSLSALGANVQKMRLRAHQEVKNLLPTSVSNNSSDVSVSKRMLNILATSKKRAKEKGNDFIPLADVFSSILREDPPGFCSTLFSKFSIDKDKFLELLENSEASQNRSLKSPKNKFLNKYARDMIAAAKRGDYSPVIGRDFEIRRLIQILCRKDKNNPILAGHPGVGKTAIAEELSRRILLDQVPDLLKSCNLYSLSISSIMAGTKHRGDLEERIEGLIKEVESSRTRCILFIDEIHMINQDSGGDASVSNLLKPALSRGKFMCIGATTFDEYRAKIESDGALSRRFQPVFVHPPSHEEAVGILRGLRETYEAFHGMQIRDEALVSATELSERYIPDRYLPDKAIDLLDEACARVRADNTLLPEEVELVRQRLLHTEIKIGSLERETDKKSAEALELARKDLAELKELRDRKMSQFEAEKSCIERFKRCKSKLLKIEAKLLDGEAGGEYRDEYYRIKTLDKPRAVAKLESAKRALSHLLPDQRMLKDEITSAEIADVVSAWTGIPSDRLSMSDKEKLRSLPKDMKELVISQDDACNAICDSVIRNRSGLSEESQPIGSFLMLGPSGVGKTETAKSLASLLFDDKNHMIRIDMSEYSDKHTVSRLIGAPPGYIGYDQGGQLTEAVRRKPFSVILFDEIEKAHPDVFDVFLQILDEGHLTDGQGRRVNFKNCVIIMTSNFGSGDLLDCLTSPKLLAESKSNILNKLRRSFRPELINRIDEVVFFNPLDHEALEKICKIQLSNLEKRLMKSDIEIEFSPDIISYIVEKTYDPPMGARPIKRFIQKNIEPKIAKTLINSDDDEIKSILIDLLQSKIRCTTK